MPLKDIEIVKDGFRTINPSEEMVLNDGWAEYVLPEPEINQPTLDELYRQRIVDLIRQKYSVDDELAIQRQRDTKVEEFNEYNAYVEACKQKAHNEINGNIEI